MKQVALGLLLFTASLISAQTNDKQPEVTIGNTVPGSAVRVLQGFVGEQYYTDAMVSTVLMRIKKIDVADPISGGPFFVHVYFEKSDGSQTVITKILDAKAFSSDQALKSDLVKQFKLRKDKPDYSGVMSYVPLGPPSPGMDEETLYQKYGYPDRKNIYNSGHEKQLIYHDGKLIVYVTDGKVTSYQEFN